MGATRKSFYHQKQFHGSIFLDLLPPNIFPDVLFSHHNELLPGPLELSRPQNVSWKLSFTVLNKRLARLESLFALPPSDHPPQWKARNF